MLLSVLDETIYHILLGLHCHDFFIMLLCYMKRENKGSSNGLVNNGAGLIKEVYGPIFAKTVVVLINSANHKMLLRIKSITLKHGELSATSSEKKPTYASHLIFISKGEVSEFYIECELTQ